MVSNTKAEEIYFTATGEEDGKPLIFRSLQNVRDGAEKSDYPYLISIFWMYSNDNSGMPDAETNNSQIDFEDALAKLDVVGTSQLMLVVTGNGRKEWHWYVNDISSWMGMLNDSLSESPAYPIEIENSHQPDWSLYFDFVKGVEDF